MHPGSSHLQGAYFEDPRHTYVGNDAPTELCRHPAYDIRPVGSEERRQPEVPAAPSGSSHDPAVGPGNNLQSSCEERPIPQTCAKGSASLGDETTVPPAALRADDQVWCTTHQKWRDRKDCYFFADDWRCRHQTHCLDPRNSARRRERFWLEEEMKDLYNKMNNMDPSSASYRPIPNGPTLVPKGDRSRALCYVHGVWRFKREMHWHRLGDWWQCTPASWCRCGIEGLNRRSWTGQQDPRQNKAAEVGEQVVHSTAGNEATRPSM